MTDSPIPSLAELGLQILPEFPGGIAMKFTLHPDDIFLIRRALESLKELEQKRHIPRWSLY